MFCDGLRVSLRSLDWPPAQAMRSSELGPQPGQFNLRDLDDRYHKQEEKEEAGDEVFEGLAPLKRLEPRGRRHRSACFETRTSHKVAGRSLICFRSRWFPQIQSCGGPAGASQTRSP